MEIIQQKLIWLTGSFALFVIVRKLQLDRAGIPRSIASRFRTGASLLLGGSLLGLISHLLSLSFYLFQIDLNYFVEIGLGYIAGWSLIIWGLIEWANPYFDKKGRPISVTGSPMISEKLARALFMKLSPNLLIDQIAADLLKNSECQAVSLHQTGPDDMLALAYQTGLAADTEKTMAIYDIGGGNMFASIIRTRQAVVTDDMTLLHQTESLETPDGPIESALGVPVILGESIVGILTIYSTDRKHFSKGDIGLLTFVANTVSSSIENNASEKSRNAGKMISNMAAMLKDVYEGPESLIQAFLESTKIIHRYVHFEKAALFLHGNGDVQTLEWNFPDGLTVRIVNGYFPIKSFPKLYGKRSISNISNFVGQSFTADLSRRPGVKANLEISFGRTISIDPRLQQIFQILGDQIVKKIEFERQMAEKERIKQWLGALRLFQQKSLASSNISEILQDIAEMIVNLAPVSFAKITMADFEKNIIKTASMGQVRNLRRLSKYDHNLSLGNIGLHMQALRENKIIRFNQDDINHKMAKKELDCMMPLGIKHGIILPISVNNRAIGLLTIGESRNFKREPLDDMNYFFVSNIAGLISTLFAWHREKLSSQLNKEGVKRLTLKLGAAAEIKNNDALPLNIKSRVNGPLAGIMASCEYLKNINPENPQDLNRYLDIIQRNANKIHQITSGDISAVKEIAAKR